MCQTCILDGQPSIPLAGASLEKSILTGQVRHLCRCEFNADGCVLFDVLRPKSQETHSFQYGDRNIHQRYCENHRYMLFLHCTSREQEIDESFVFCGKRKQKCPIILQNHHGTRSN